MFGTFKAYIMGFVAMVISGLLLLLRLKEGTIEDLEFENKSQEVKIRSFQKADEMSDIADDIEDEIDDLTDDDVSEQEVDVEVQEFKDSNELKI